MTQPLHFFTMQYSRKKNTVINTIASVLFLLFVSSVNYAAEKSLYIFMPSEYNAVDIENVFAEKYPTLTIRAFGNIAEFKKSVMEEKPTAIITKTQVLKSFSEYSVALNAISKASDEETYFFISVDKQLNIRELAVKNVGVLDFLGKKEIDAFLVNQAGIQPSLTKVKKMADLLPLLTMNMVDAVFVTSFQAEYLKKRSDLNLIVTRCSSSSGIGVLALSRQDAALTEQIDKMQRDLCKMLGFDSWQPASK